MRKLFTNTIAMLIVIVASLITVKAQTYLAITEETSIDLTKANIDALDYLSVSTQNWATAKTYCSIAGDFYNMSSIGRILSINVSNVDSFDVYIHNTNAGRIFTITVGSGSAQTFTHTGSSCESFSLATGDTQNLTIKLEGGGSSVYPAKIVLYPPTSPTITKFSVAGIDASIDQDAKTITAELPFGTNLSSIEPTVTVGGTATGYSPTGAQDFSGGSVTYTATDGTNNTDYAVTLTASTTASSDKELTDVQIGGYTPSFDSESDTYSVILPKASSLNQIITFTKPGTASANFVSGSTADFSSTVDITVTAQDNSTKTYHFTATVGTKNIAYVTISGNNDPYLHGDLLSKGYYVEDIIAASQDASYFADFDLAVLFDAIPSSNTLALNMKDLIETKRFLNLKAYMYGKTGWPTGSGVNIAGESIATVATNYISHPIFSGLTFSGNNINVLGESVISTNNGLQGVSAPGSGTVIATMSGNSAAACIIEDNTVENAIYLLIGISNDNIANISEDGKLLLDNAINYLLGDNKFIPATTSTANVSDKNFYFDGNMVHNTKHESLILFDAVGRRIICSENDIEMNDLSKGMYFVKGNNATMKIILF
ncbi:MAG: hypothetical protein PHH37_08615 [Paludibacter sp.]|nr:hypothetical protein [Paludibacter sp.]